MHNLYYDMPRSNPNTVCLFCSSASYYMTWALDTDSPWLQLMYGFKGRACMFYNLLIQFIKGPFAKYAEFFHQVCLVPLVSQKLHTSPLKVVLSHWSGHQHQGQCTFIFNSSAVNPHLLPQCFRPQSPLMNRWDMHRFLKSFHRVYTPTETQH